MPNAEDYPRTLDELESRFTDEVSCREYLATIRWPGGFRCPKCRSASHWVNAAALRICQDCGHHASVTAGTIFALTRFPLRVWFRAMWWVCTQKNGASALGLKRILGVNSYQTAWAWLHKLRRAMVRPGRDRLAGTIQLDEARAAGIRVSTNKSGVSEAPLVLVAAQLDGTRIGRIRMALLDEAGPADLQRQLEAMIEPGATLVTDAWHGYARARDWGYRHVVKRPTAHVGVQPLPHCRRVANLMNRWLLGTHQGAVQPAHLPYYLDEYVFRFNRRASHARGKLFFRLLEQALQTDPHPLQVITRSAVKKSRT